VHKTKLGVVPTQSIKNEQHGRVTAQSDMTVEELEALHHQLKENADNLGVLILPE
jgi:hypothetical protein